VQTGQIFDGRIASDVAIGGDINNSGQIAFTVTFTTGERALYLATPVPEPSMFALAALGGLAMLASSRHRN
jgi:hypothetical protein